MSSLPIIANSASIAESAYPIGGGTIIDEAVIIHAEVRIGRWARILSGAKIAAHSMIGDKVIVGPNTYVGMASLILDGARVCPNNVVSNSSDARKLKRRVSIGPNVLLHDEVELANGAIVPTQRTIASIGTFGMKNRVVTIYGSDYGPRMSIGCQVGVSYPTIVERVAQSTSTVSPSAETYAPYLSIFQEIGRTVQTAYEGESHLVEEIKAMREEYGLNTAIQF